MPALRTEVWPGRTCRSTVQRGSNPTTAGLPRLQCRREPSWAADRAAFLRKPRYPIMPVCDAAGFSRRPVSLFEPRTYKIGACQAFGEPRFPHFSTLLGGQLSGFVSRSHASGGSWRVRGMRAPWWRSMSVRHYCLCAPRIGAGGTCQVAVSGTVRYQKQRRGASWPRRSASPRRRSPPSLLPAVYGTDDATGYISLSYVFSRIIR